MAEVAIILNGLFVKVPAGATILEACQQEGIEIPTLCHHPELRPEGHCRLCLVEIGEPPATRLVNSCTYPVTQGLNIQTQSEKVRQVRRLVLELLLARAPKAEIVQQYAREYGLTGTRFKIEDPEERCILCAQCVRTCREVVGVSAISMAFRAPEKQVAPPFKEPPPACIGCGSCAFVCPTNVITYTEKDGVRTIWGRKFELVRCNVCGNFIAPLAQLEYWARLTGDPVTQFFVCRDCR